MNSTRISLPNFNSPFSTACFLPIGWFLTQTKSLSGHLTLMSTFLLGNKESGRPGLPRVLTQASQAQATAGKPILSFDLSCAVLYFSILSAEFVPTPFSCGGRVNWCMATPTAFPSPFSFPVPSYHVGSSPTPFHSPRLGGFMKSHSYQPCNCK